MEQPSQEHPPDSGTEDDQEQSGQFNADHPQIELPNGRHFPPSPDELLHDDWYSPEG